jgi:REP element-mobilizing transposase RayT
MPIVRTPGCQVVVCMRWSVAAPEIAALDRDAVSKLVPYATRYAETMNIRVLAVGGAADHLHVLADIPPDMTLDKVARELQRPTERYLREVLGLHGLAWDAETAAVCSVSPGDVERVAAYVRDQAAVHASGDLDPLLEGIEEDEAEGADEEGEIPDWIKGVLKPGGGAKG